MRCVCGNELPQNANFCNKCGNRIESSGGSSHLPSDKFVSKEEFDKLVKKVHQLTVRVKKLETEIRVHETED
jgi:zinc-ribbon domain